MTTRWTTIPPWLYQNTLPADELQEVHVREARKKVDALREEELALSVELDEVMAKRERAEEFLEHAEAALKNYRMARYADRLLRDARVPPTPDQEP